MNIDEELSQYLRIDRDPLVDLSLILPNSDQPDGNYSYFIRVTITDIVQSFMNASYRHEMELVELILRL